MKLRKIEIAGFRGFNTAQEIEFAGDLILISGGNGNGKTSLVEALEWLLFGYTTRRIKGDALSKREHDDSYGNVHFPGDAEAFVSATVETGSSTHVVKRILNADETSVLELDGTRVSDLSTMGIMGDHQKPFVIQHGLRDFIFSRPIDRYRILSGMLGLDELIQFRDAADRSKTEYRNTTDEDIRAARDTLSSFQRRIRADDRLAALDTLLEEGSAKQQEFLVSVLAVSSAATGEGSQDKTIQQQQLRIAHDEARDKVFDIDALRPQPFGDQERTRLDERRGAFAKTSGERIATLSETLQGEQGAYDPDRIRFLSLGLKYLNPEDPSQCPFCLQRTLSGQQVRDYRQEVQETSKDTTSVVSVADAVLREERVLLTEMERILVRSPSKAIRTQLGTFLATRTDLFKTYSRAALDIAKARRECRRLSRRLEGTLIKIAEAERSGTFDEAIFTGYEGDLLALHDLAHQVESARSGYEASFSRVEAVLTPMISTDKDVRHLALLWDILTQLDDIAAGLSDIDVTKRLLDLVRQTREFIEKKQKEILDSKNDALVGWYELLNPSEKIGFKGIDVGTDALHLKAESYGQQIGAAASLSEAHLNCLGLSVYLMQSIDLSLPYRFVVIDDPIQSMDQGHRDRFADDLVSELLKRGYQVIILSHLYTFIGELQQLHRLQFPYCLEFAAYEKTGPTIIEDVPPLKDYLKRAKEYQAAAGKEYRRECCRYLRLLVERFCKELYIEEAGNVIPRAYRAESFDKLRDLLRQTSFKPKDESGLKNTFDFATSSHHDDVKNEPPTSEQLQKHISRIENLIRKYNLASK